MGSFLNFVEIIEYTATEDGKCLMKQDWSCKTHIGRYIDGWFESQFLGICRKNAQDGIKGRTQSYVTKDPYDSQKPNLLLIHLWGFRFWSVNWLQCHRTLARNS